jgi:ubiquinone/menaquinone biosynthesis C-methylase UbiE
VAIDRGPVPPEDLTRRVGAWYEGADREWLFDDFGRSTRDELLAILPGGWSFDGKRVLDFGCGSGRVLRQFLTEAEAGEFWGCDIDGPSIEWLKENLVPPLHVFVNSELPPLPQTDEWFDAIWAASVFTHLTSSWSAWLLELHRVLKPRGLLLVSYIGQSTGLPGIDDWNEDRTGMNILDGGLNYAEGGPTVLHSEWWIRTHWGRAFEIGRIEPRKGKQAWVLLRKRPVSLTVDELEAVEDTERREIDALRHNIAQIERRHRDAVLENRRLMQQLSEVLKSHSWRLTRPLRATRRRVRNRAG